MEQEKIEKQQKDLRTDYRVSAGVAAMSFLGYVGLQVAEIAGVEVPNALEILALGGVALGVARAGTAIYERNTFDRDPDEYQANETRKTKRLAAYRQPDTMSNRVE